MKVIYLEVVLMCWVFQNRSGIQESPNYLWIDENS
jgi:hypothetical protein